MSEEKEPIELKIALKHGSDHHTLFEKYGIEILKERGDGRFDITMQNRGWLDDLSEEGVVLSLLWCQQNTLHTKGMII